MGCPNCKCKDKSKSEPTNILNEYSQKKQNEIVKSKILDYQIFDYVDQEGNKLKTIEVILEDYVIEIDNVESKEITIDSIVDYLILNKLIYID